MISKDNKLIFKFVFEILFLNLSSKVIMILLILFYTLNILFSHYLESFKDKFIDKLKMVYPTAYIHTAKNIKPINQKYFHYKDIFEVNFDGIKYSFAKNDKTNQFVNISIRSFHKENIPSILKNKQNQLKNTIFVSQKIFNHLITQKKYKNGIHINSFINNKNIFVKVKKINLFDDTNWILIENSLAKMIFPPTMFNKNVIVNKFDKQNKEEVIFEDYKSFNNLFFWYDNLSFSSKVFYKITNVTYDLFYQSFSMLIFLFGFITLKNIIYELKKMTLFAARYGKNLIELSLIYFIGLSIYFSIIFLLSFVIAFFINNSIKYILNLDYIISFPYFEYCEVLLLIIVIVLSFVIYYGRIVQRLDYV